MLAGQAQTESAQAVWLVNLSNRMGQWRALLVTLESIRIRLPHPPTVYHVQQIILAGQELQGTAQAVWPANTNRALGLGSACFVHLDNFQLF